DPAQPQSSTKVTAGEPGRDATEIEQIADVDRGLEERHRGHGDFEKRLLLEAPAVGLQGPEPLAEAAKGLAALLPLPGRQVAGLQEVVEAGEGPEESREGRGVVLVAASRQYPQHRLRDAEPRPAKADRPLSRGALDGLLGAREFLFDLSLGIEVQPRLVLEGV